MTDAGDGSVDDGDGSVDDGDGSVDTGGDSTRAGDGPAEAVAGSADAAIEDMLALERELEADLGSAATGDAPAATRGNIAGATKVPASDVPADYPVPVGTDEALRIDVETGDGTATTYCEWDGAETGHVARLLAALDREPADFANIYGDRVALDAVDGHYGIDLAATRALHGVDDARADPRVRRGRLAIAAILGVGTLGLLLLSLGSDAGAGAVLLASVGLPPAIYLDLDRVREHVPWPTREWAWIVGSLLPLLNLSIAAAYLVERRVRLRGVVAGDVPREWRLVVLAGVAMELVALPFVGAGLSAASALYFVSIGLLPLGVYFDARYVAAGTDWDPGESVWAAATLAGALLSLGFLVAVPYLYLRRGHV